MQVLRVGDALQHSRAAAGGSGRLVCQIMEPIWECFLCMLEAVGFIVWVGLLCCQVHGSTPLTGLSHATMLLHCISLGCRTCRFGCLISSLPAQHVVREILAKQSADVQDNGRTC